ncbi:MAG: hypothetical protein HC923_00915 [Myxococcales bacterium]|nr:hypothetical protein [Myxococcales bacterium]
MRMLTAHSPSPPDDVTTPLLVPLSAKTVRTFGWLIAWALAPTACGDNATFRVELERPSVGSVPAELYLEGEVLVGSGGSVRRRLWAP